MQILDGLSVASTILDNVRAKVDELHNEKILPKLAVVMLGENPASVSYVSQKMKACEKTGILCNQINLPETTSQDELLEIISKLNSDNQIHGILVQLPLPKHIAAPIVLKSVSPRKDVDGFQAYNLGKMFLGKEFEDLAPCTPVGIIKLLDHYNIKIEGQNITVVGASNIVGKPVGVMLTNRDATVTVCNIHTKNLKQHTLHADILVVAVGKPDLITADMVKDGAIVVDVGCTKVGDKLKGDVDFENVKLKASFITPVPKGIGPMTVACLMENTLKACVHLEKEKQVPIVII